MKKSKKSKKIKKTKTRKHNKKIINSTARSRKSSTLHLLSFKTPEKREGMSGEGDADFASSMRNGVKRVGRWE